MGRSKSELLYSKIANKLNEIIPTEWNKILLYTEVTPGVVSHYYCFYEANSNDLVQFGDIAERYGVDADELRYAELELTRIIEGLNDEFANADQQRWTTLTFILKSNSEFDVDYGYEDLSATNEIFRRKEWKKKYLNVKMK